jgi:hypothetical protein
VKRPALIRMLNAAKDSQFQVVVVRDETRVGGDITRTGLLICSRRVMHWVNDDDRDAWRDHMTRSQIPFIEYEIDGDPHFMVPEGSDPDPDAG